MLTYCMFELVVIFLLKSSQHSLNKALAFARRVLTEVFVFPHAARCLSLLSKP